MIDEKVITQRVALAQQNIDEADSLIRDYLPFIKKVTARTMGRIPREGEDDELSIALMGFHEAIESFNLNKGEFFSFASLVIERRLADFYRSESRFRRDVSYEENIMNTKEGERADHLNSSEELHKDNLKQEIIEFTKELAGYGITVSELAAESHGYKKTMIQCREAVDYITARPELMEKVIKKGELPVKELLKATSVKEKTLERHRKYILSLVIIYFRKYDCMIKHLSQVFKSQKGGK